MSKSHEGRVERLVPQHISYPEQLPVVARKDEIMRAIAENQVVVIAGETGSGKTTQLPKMCLELGRGREKRIGHTQPRRIAARAVSSRIAEELNSQVGGLVGYQVRFNDDVTDQTAVKVMTDGILLAELSRDRQLQAYDTLIIDESWQPSETEHSRFGEECWLQRDKSGGLEVRRQPHNAFMIFLQESPVLSFLIHTIESMIKRVDSDHIAPQMVGPKLLKALHSLAHFDLEPEAGAMSPVLLDAVRRADMQIIEFFRERNAPAPKCLNLCASLIDDSDVDVQDIRQRVARLL